MSSEVEGLDMGGVVSTDQNVHSFHGGKVEAGLGAVSILYQSTKPAEECTQPVSEAQPLKRAVRTSTTILIALLRLFI